MLTSRGREGHPTASSARARPASVPLRGPPGRARTRFAQTARAPRPAACSRNRAGAPHVLERSLAGRPSRPLTVPVGRSPQEAGEGLSHRQGCRAGPPGWRALKCHGRARGGVSLEPTRARTGTRSRSRGPGGDEARAPIRAKRACAGAPPGRSGRGSGSAARSPRRERRPAPTAAPCRSDESEMMSFPPVPRCPGAPVLSCSRDLVTSCSRPPFPRPRSPGSAGAVVRPGCA
jgi:hypothetical protein